MAKGQKPDLAPRGFGRILARGRGNVIDQTEETVFKEQSFGLPTVSDWEDPEEVKRVVSQLYLAVGKLQEAVREATHGLRTLPPWVTIQNVALVTGNNIIQHYLNRPYRGWRIVRMRDGFGAVYETPNSGTELGRDKLDRLQLTLVSDADFAADLEIW